MSSRYRVDYALKKHRHDEFIQFIKSLLSTPFVLYAVKPAGTISDVEEIMVDSEARRRYAEIFHDLESLVDNHIEMTNAGVPELSRLHQLVPSIGTFFTPLPLEKAFYIEDERRSISKRRLVAPSFNDIRLILNTAQIIWLATAYQTGRSTNRYLKMKTHGLSSMTTTSEEDRLKLITFDGDITLYEDGENIESTSPIITELVKLLSKGIYIGIVTAAGYKAEEKYEERFYGLIEALKESASLEKPQCENLLIVGGEANYVMRYNNEKGGLVKVPSEEWMLDEMKEWKEEDIKESLDFAAKKFGTLIKKLRLHATVMKKERSVGIVPMEGHKLIREQLEEVVLRIDRDLRRFQPAQRLKWCAFNGGSDVWVDIGDKSFGVRILQSYIAKHQDIVVGPKNTLHVGDQFASLGANDYASRTAAATAWISSPNETKKLLRDLISFMDDWATF
ncbi:hypothetical protein HII13_002468 [Brettanomyces bruxellensis]|nr:hypothetical protein HII13_002468 [Brettanomyces bruxellensis]